jgi:hypothetical protein
MVRVKTTTRSGLLVLIGWAISACVANGTGGLPGSGPTVYPPDAFAHRVAAPDVTIYWNCTRPEPGTLQFDGVVQNTGGREVRFVELQLDGVDAREGKMAHASTALPDIVLYTNQISSFHMQVPTTGVEARYDLFYQYRLASRPGLMGLSDSDQHFMARDVCSETQHRVR